MVAHQMSDLTINSPIVVLIAVSLYTYNVSPADRITKLIEHFGGECMEAHELFAILDGDRRARWWATELPFPTAKVYADHAMERYGAEALERARANDR